MGNEIRQKRDEKNPQDDSEGRFQDEMIAAGLEIDWNRSQGIRKDFTNMKLMVNIWIILTKNILGLKIIQIKSCPEITYPCH